MGTFTERLARASSRRPWTVVIAWLVTLVVSMVIVILLLGSALKSGRDIPGSDYQRGKELLEQRLPADEPTDYLIVRSSTLTVDDQAFRSRVEQLTEEIAATEGVERVTNFYRDPRSAAVSENRRSTLIPFKLSGDENDAEKYIEGPVLLAEESDGQGGFDVFITGQFTAERDQSLLSEEDLQKGELFFGLPAAVIILVLVFGALGAAALPLTLALVSIGVALGATALIGQVFDLSLFVVNMLTGMGLALGIDYSLFVLSRYREERARGREKLDAIAAAGSTASRAVFFSGVVFVVALTGMLLVPDSVLRSLATGAILVGIVAVASAMTLLPALLSLFGDKVNALRVPILGRNVEQQAGREGRFWSAVARVVMGRPVVSLVLSAAVLLALGVPVLDLKVGAPGVAVFPDRLLSKQGLTVLNEEFPGRGIQPAEIVIEGDVAAAAVQGAIERLQTSLEGDRKFGPPTLRANDQNDVALLTVPFAAEARGDESAMIAVRDLRNEKIPPAFQGVDAKVYVTGEGAEAVDAAAATGRWLPFVFAFVLGMSFVALLIAFRSIVVPLKAIILNLLSVGAAYGLLVLVFQKGYGTDLLGFTQVATVESWVPLFLFSVLFALSMDYHVFLLSRIRERFSDTRNNSEAVAYGVGSTARLITGAALIMIAVFTGFAIGDLVMFQQMGFGLAVALLLDATIVRSVLLPASMELLGERNWYLPSWLEWLPRFEMEGPHEKDPPATPRPEPTAP